MISRPQRRLHRGSARATTGVPEPQDLFGAATPGGAPAHKHAVSTRD